MLEILDGLAVPEYLGLVELDQLVVGARQLHAIIGHSN
jgi:hypothetical protein